MGWKNIKEHYRIKHLIQLTPEGVSIGSGYIPDLIVVSRTGEVLKRYDERSNDDLRRYQAEIDASPEKFVELLQAPDHFERAIPVYTFDGAVILEKFCEELGWPNTTHDGLMMYDNRFFANRSDAIAKAKREAAAGVQMVENHLQRLREDVAKWEARLAEHQNEVATLATEHPETQESSEQS
jgi:hypothetical protein